MKDVLQMSLFAICSNRISPEIINSLSEHGINVIAISDCQHIPYPVASHPDMLFFNNKKGTVICEKTTYDKLSLPEIDCRILTDNFEKKELNNYPFDIRFNAALFEDFLFCREKYISPLIIQNVSAKIVDIKQGYAACSACKVNEYSFITSDISLKKAADKCGLDALLIQPGHIEIDCYDYGFIGGASALLGNKLFFFGDISKHPDYNEIAAFAHHRNVEVITLSKEKLFDYGGVFLLPAKQNITQEIHI